MEPLETTPKRARKALVPRWVPVAAAALVLIVAAAVLPRLFARPETTTVPNIAGLDVAVARSRLGEARLLLVYGDRRFSSTVPENGVIEQDLSPGSVVEVRTAVTVILSAGSEEFLMPDVLGMSVAEARATLEAKGLRVAVEPVPSAEPSGTILASFPAPGSTVRTSDAVRLSVAASRDASGSLRPYALAGMCFVVDPAPMPEASGPASGTPDVPLEIARRLRSLLEASGATVTVTRSITDNAESTSASQRAARAVQASCTAVIGLAVSESGQGVQVLTIAPNAERPALFIPSSDFARRLSESLTSVRITAPVSVAASDPVLAAVQMPGLRVVLGSVSSPVDRTAFRDPDWADRVARAIYRAVGEAFDR